MTAPAQLTCDYASLVNDVGFHLYGLRPTSVDVITDAVASADQATDILRCISKGLQYVYSTYRWSFLRPLVPITTHAAYSTGTITVDVSGNVTGIGTTFPTYSFSAGGWLYISSVGSFAVASYVSGVALTLAGYNAAAVTVASIFSLGFDSYPLPAGVDSLEGRLTYAQGSQWSSAESLEKRSEVEIRRLLARNNMPGRPRMYAETMNTFDPTAGSSRYVTLYPIPDDEYTLTAVGTLRPSMIDSTNKYPLGIEVLAPCIAESCLAAVEREMDDGEGVHTKTLPSLLAAAIQRDKEYGSPDTLGVDNGQEECDCRGPHPRNTSIYWNAGGGITGWF